MATVTGLSRITSTGNGTKEVLLTLNANITAVEVLAQQNLNFVGPLFDQVLLPLVPGLPPVHRVTDVGLGLVGDGIMEPLFARDETERDPRLGGIGLIKKFDGSGFLRDQNITLQAHIHNGLGAGPYELVFDSNVGASLKQNGLWLPDDFDIFGLVPAANTGTATLTETFINPQLRSFLFAASETRIQDGATIEFFFTDPPPPVAPALYFARLISDRAADWYRGVRPWAFDIRDIRRQRGEVTILNNVIDPTRGETVKLHYELSKSGMVTINVFDLKGDIVDVLFRGRRDAGDYTTSWDGRNRGNRIVARGIYFIKVVAPGINEIRKVLVVK